MEKITTHRVVSRIMIEFAKWDRKFFDAKLKNIIIKSENGNLNEISWKFKNSVFEEIDYKGSKIKEKHYARIYVSNNEKNAVVVFRSSRKKEGDWRRNFQSMREKIGNMMWHKGYYYIFKGFVNNGIWDKLKTNIDKNTKVWFTGHSMGGAIATIASFYFNKEKRFNDYTFGGMISFGAPPSVWNAGINEVPPPGFSEPPIKYRYPFRYNKIVNKKKCCNHVNQKDPVPRISFNENFLHVGRINNIKMIDDKTPIGNWFDGCFWNPEGKPGGPKHHLMPSYENNLGYWWKEPWFP